MRGPKSFCQRGSKFDNVLFLVDEGIEDPNTTINVPLSAGHANGVSLAGQ